MFRQHTIVGGESAISVFFRGVKSWPIFIFYSKLSKLKFHLKIMVHYLLLKIKKFLML